MRSITDEVRDCSTRRWLVLASAPAGSGKSTLLASWLAERAESAPLMESRSTAGPATLRHHEATLDCLRNGGHSIEMSAHAYALIDAFIYGFALLEANLPVTGGQDMADLAETIIEPLPADLYPRLIELTAEHILQSGYHFGDEFDFGLDLILNGLQAAAKLPNP